MKTPVLIPARNEAATIGLTLRSLGQIDSIEPVVIANGCDDDTAGLAAAYGAIVLESREGKVPALQAGLAYLGKRALQPLMILDADTIPRSRHWADTMLGAVASSERPAIAWGLVRYRNPNDRLSTLVRTARATQIQWSDRHAEKPRRVTGCNTALHCRNEAVVDSLMAMDNYWPGEDVAIHDTVLAHGGLRRTVLSPQAVVETDAERWPSVWNRLRAGRRIVKEIMQASYLTEAPAGSVPYHRIPD